MLSRPSRILTVVLAALVIGATLTATAGAQWRGPGTAHRADRRASAFRAQITSPRAGDVAGTIKFAASVRGTSNAKVTFAVDGTPTNTTSGRNPSTTVNTARLTEGRHILAVSARNGSHTSTARVAVTINRKRGGKTTTPTEGGGSPSPSSPEKTAIGTGQKAGGKSPEKPVKTPPTPTETTPPAPAPETPVSTPVTPPEEPVSPTGAKILWGAWIGEQFTGAQAPWDMNAVTQFEKLTKKPISLLNFSSPFANCPSSSSPTTSCSFYSFPKNEMEAIRTRGEIPFFSWASSMLPVSTSQPNFQLSDVIEGKFDSYIRNWALAAKAWGHPFFLRFNWEMNGKWFQWAEGVNGNAAGQYVAAWRHVHDIFTSVGATNATWTWCPNVDPEGRFQNLASLYPGNEYVDWTCLDGYNRGSDPAAPDKWRTFSSLFGSTYKTITESIAPTKPMIVGEVGSTEYGGSKATWITEMLSEMPTKFPKMRGFLWFEKGEEPQWPIETSESATNAFAAGIANPIYTGNTFSSLPATAIQPVT